MGKMFMAASNYLPTQVSDMMNQDRAFATGRLNFSGQRNICSLSTYVRPRPPSAGKSLRRAVCPECKVPKHVQGAKGQETAKRKGEQTRRLPCPSAAFPPWLSCLFWGGGGAGSWHGNPNFLVIMTLS